MELRQETVSGISILVLEGRFDAYEVPALNTWFDNHPSTGNVIVDLSQVGFIDSSGLASLVRGLKQCRNNGGDLYLAGMQQAVKIIFELTRLDKAFEIFEDHQEAIHAFSTSG